MNHEQQALWQRIRDFRIDAPGASFPYSKRLAREQGWTPAYTARVIEEYRRFAFLSVAAGHGVTPSKAVDEAWHLHLVYTRNYWDGFCAEALGRPLHHNPADGGAENDAKYAGWYDATLASYERLFGQEPPEDIWRAEPKPKRSWLRATLLAPFLAGCAEPANPLDWRGPEFLGLFFVLYGAALLVAFLLRQALTGPSDGPPTEEWELSLNDQAYLNGGPTLALATSLAFLTALGPLEVDRKTRRFRRTEFPHPFGDPLDRAVLQATDPGTGAKYEEIARRAKAVLAEMEGSLRRQGLWTRPETLIAATAVPFVVACSPLVLGAVKIAVGVSRDRPIGFLALGCLAGLVVNLALLVPPKRSRYGDRVLQRLRDARPSAPRVGHGATMDAGDLAFGMALFGLTVLEGGEYAYLRPAILPPSAASSGGEGGGSSCGASSCGTSSCGGGGGCGGGGCGGCGSS